MININQSFEELELTGEEEALGLLIKKDNSYFLLHLSSTPRERGSPNLDKEVLNNGNN